MYTISIPISLHLSLSLSFRCWTLWTWIFLKFMLPIFLLRTQPSNNGSSFLEAIRQKPFFQASQVSATRSSGPNGSLDGWNTIAWFGRSGFVFGCWVLGHWDDLSVKVGSLYFQSPVLHGSVFHWPGCSSRISHTACHLAALSKVEESIFGRFCFLESCNFSQVWYFCILNLDPKIIAWIGFTTSQNSGSSRPWNKFLASDPGRNIPILHNLMALAVGGKHRWNEMLYDTQPHHQITPKILRGLSYIMSLQDYRVKEPSPSSYYENNGFSWALLNPGHMPYASWDSNGHWQVPRCAPRLPQCLGHFESTGPFPWMEESSWRQCLLPSSWKPPILSFCWMFVWGSLYSKSTGTSELKNEDKRWMFGDQTFSTHDFHAYIALGLNHDWSKHGEIMTEMASQERKTTRKLHWHLGAFVGQGGSPVSWFVETKWWRGDWDAKATKETVSVDASRPVKAEAMSVSHLSPMEKQKQPGRESARGRMNRMRTWSRWKKHSENSCCFWTPIGLHIISHFWAGKP